MLFSVCQIQHNPLCVDGEELSSLKIRRDLGEVEKTLVGLPPPFLPTLFSSFLVSSLPKFSQFLQETILLFLHTSTGFPFDLVV